MAKRKPATTATPAAATTAADYERRKQRAAETQAAQSRAGRDIGPLPAVADPARRAACRDSFERFCRTYLGEVFYLGWSPDHRKAIDRIETAVRSGGLFAYAMPRGSGKTSLAEAACLWALLYGYREFVVLIGSDADGAAARLDSIKAQVESNDVLAEDFPEACYPVRRLEQIHNRAKGQTLNGKPTHIEWTADLVVLPTIKGATSSGAALRCVGITGSLRGLKHARRDGRSARPDLVVIDDPQTDESARSPSQSAARVRTLNGAVLGLAGPGKKISGFLPCTVIEPGDMADQILDRQKHPAWQGERFKLVAKWPDKWDELWVGQYARIRADGLRAGDDGKAATAFYAANREAMDAGAVVAWAARHNPDELSAIQHAANLRLDRGDATFFAEYQNAPLSDAKPTDGLTAEQIAARVNNRPRGEVPLAATRLTAFIDVQKPALYWSVCAWADDFTGWLIDYGTFPDQPREYFALREIKRTAALALGTDSLEATIYQGLKRLTGTLLGQEWNREDGTRVRIDRCLIDANWGESTEVVYQFCRESDHAALLVPTHGRYVGATSQAFNQYKPKRGDEIGDHWRRPAPLGRRSVRYGLFDSNFWKSFLFERLSTPQGGPGSFSLFGSAERGTRGYVDHKLLSEHLTSEEPVRVEAKGRVVTEWKLRNTRPDNHWLDCLAGCCVGASMLRVQLAERSAPKAKVRQRVRLSELQKQKSAGR